MRVLLAGSLAKCTGLLEAAGAAERIHTYSTRFSTHLQQVLITDRISAHLTACPRVTPVVGWQAEANRVAGVCRSARMACGKFSASWGRRGGRPAPCERREEAERAPTDFDEATA